MTDFNTFCFTVWRKWPSIHYSSLWGSLNKVHMQLCYFSKLTIKQWFQVPVAAGILHAGPFFVKQGCSWHVFSEGTIKRGKAICVLATVRSVITRDLTLPVYIRWRNKAKTAWLSRWSTSPLHQGGLCHKPHIHTPGTHSRMLNITYVYRSGNTHRHGCTCKLTHALLHYALSFIKNYEGMCLC